jgi:hypothetical protein
MAFTKVTPAGISTTGTVVLQNINVSGVVTATSFVGDGSGLTNLSGMGVPVSTSGFGADVFYTNTVGYVSATTTLSSTDPNTARILYTRYQEISVNNGVDLIIGNGNDLLVNIFQIS